MLTVDTDYTIENFAPLPDNKVCARLYNTSRKLQPRDYQRFQSTL